VFAFGGTDLFVNREQEIKNITKLLLTGDVLVIGEAGIGKTATIKKIIENLIKEKGQKIAVIYLFAVPNSYPEWLSEKLAMKIYEELKSNEKLFSKFIKWLKKHGPEILEILKSMQQQQMNISLEKSVGTSSFPIVTSPRKRNLPRDYKQAVFKLLDQFVKQTKKEVLITIDDAHELSIYDREFLTDLLANHGKNIHILISRRPQEKLETLSVSPEISYFMKINRKVTISGLNDDAVGQFLQAHHMNYDQRLLSTIRELLNGNPYFLNLLVTVATTYDIPLRDKEFKKLVRLGISKFEEYLHSHFYVNLKKFDLVLKAASVLPSHIHAELLSYMLNGYNCQSVHEQILELERRGIFCKDEFGEYRFFHPLFQLYIYNQLLTSTERLLMHKAAASYYKKLAEDTPAPLSLIASLYHARKSLNKETEFWALQEFASIYRTVNRFRESKEYAQKALQMAIQLKDEEKEFETLIFLLSLMPYTKIDEPDKKLTRLKQLIKNEKIKTKRNEINVSLAEANYFIGLGKLVDAIKPTRKCSRLAKQIGDELNFFSFTENEAELLIDIGQIEKARKKLTTCLKGFEKLNVSHGIMATLLSMGNLECMFNPKKAIEFYQRSLEIAKKSKNYVAVATALHGMGIASFELNDVSQAVKLFKKCVRISQKMGDMVGLATTYVELARVMIPDGRFREASKIIKKVQMICEDLGNIAGLAHVELLIGEMLDAKGKNDEAKRRFLYANKLFTELGDSKKADYALLRANNVGFWYASEWARKVWLGEYEAKIGFDGLTDAERRLNPFVGKNVRITVNQGKWKGIPTLGMKLVYEGILHKEQYTKRIMKFDRLMGHGRFNWWIEGKVVKGVKPSSGNFLIIPFFVKSIKEIK